MGIHELKDFPLELRTQNLFSNQYIRGALKALNISNLYFPCIYLPPPLESKSKLINGKYDYCLWGISLLLTSELNSKAGLPAFDLPKLPCRSGSWMVDNFIYIYMCTMKNRPSVRISTISILIASIAGALFYRKALL